MKTTKFLLLTAAFIAAVSCSATSRTAAENTNAGANAANVATPTATPPVVNEKSAATTAAPDTVVKDLYKAHDKGDNAIVQGENRKILDQYFDKNLADLIWKDMTTNKGEIGVIDFDIFYNAQDTEIKKFSVGAPKIENGKATVPVTFENYGRKESLVYSLVERGAAWKISDIKYSSGDTLLGYFKDAATNDSAPSSETGEFEGKYQIGDTTCTVKPVKMAFEVRWAKGSGVEMFFFESRDNDRYIFASDPDSGKANSFVFDDENYNTGTFYRADGKEFPISRIK